MNKYLHKLTDQKFIDWPDLELMVKNESKAQISKWGVQTHSIFEWLAYTTEELGELSNAISERYYRRGPTDEIVKEAIQTATLCLKIAEMVKDLDGIRK